MEALTDGRGEHGHQGRQAVERRQQWDEANVEEHIGGLDQGDVGAVLFVGDYEASTGEPYWESNVSHCQWTGADAG